MTSEDEDGSLWWDFLNAFILSNTLFVEGDGDALIKYKQWNINIIAIIIKIQQKWDSGSCYSRVFVAIIEQLSQYPRGNNAIGPVRIRGVSQSGLLVVLGGPRGVFGHPLGTLWAPFGLLWGSLRVPLRYFHGTSRVAWDFESSMGLRE